MIQNSFNRRRPIALIIFLAIGMFLMHVVKVQGQATLGARDIALGQATTALPNSTWSVFQNPAMVSKDQPSVSFFGLRYYGIAELTDVAAAISYPTSIGVIGGGAHRYGNDLFNETRLRLSYKNSFQKFHYGVAVNYNHVAQGGGFGSFGALGVDVGLAALIFEDFWIGAKAININQPQYGEVNNIVEELPRNLSIGFSYRMSGVALFTTDVVKDVNFPISYRGGIEVVVVDNLKARAGVTTAPQTFSGGFGYNTDHWGVNIVMQRHEEVELGYSPGLDLNISW
jgi:hypothetical protein